MSKIKKILLIVLLILLVAIALFFIIRPCPKYYLSQIYPDRRYAPLTERLVGWYVRTFCPGAIPVSMLINTAFAQSANTDLINLRTNFPTLVRAYDKIKIFDAWSVINAKLAQFSHVSVGIIDTGIDAQHPEFNNVNFENSPISALEDKAIEFPNGLPSGHGTAVAGIISANNLSSSQILPQNSPQMNGIIAGIANPSYTIESRSARGLSTSVKIDSIISTFPVSSIINISFKQVDCLILNIFCVKTEDFNNLTKLYQETFAANPDKTFVIAAGNDDINVQKSIPSNINLPNTIVVAASNLEDNRATFGFLGGSSNFGAGISISAPGLEIYAPAIRGKGNFPTNGSEAFNYKTDFSGTSASAPMVTGVAGLIKAIRPELSPAQIKNILTKTENTDPVITESDKPIGRRLNALKAVCDSLVGLNCPTAPPPQPSNTWKSVGPMTTERADHTATLLNDGRVLVTGGFKGAGNSFTVLASAEIFNPNNNTFTSVGNMTTPRAFHTATLLLDGRVLIAGGNSDVTGTNLSSAEIFNPATNAFSPVGNLNSKRFYHTADLLPDGKVLIAGGNSIALKSTEIFDPNTNVFTLGTDMTVPRSHAVSALLNDGRVLIVNGLLSGTLMSVDIYNPATNIFTSATSSAEQLGLSASTLPNGKVLILGGKLFNQANGQAAEIFDPADNSFVEIGPMLIFDIARNSLVLLNSGQVLFVGTSIKAQIFNPQTNEFKLTGDLNTLRFTRHRLTLLQDGRALVTGGQLSDVSFITTNGAEVYKP